MCSICVNSIVKVLFAYRHISEYRRYRRRRFAEGCAGRLNAQTITKSAKRFSFRFIDENRVKNLSKSLEIINLNNFTQRHNILVTI